MQDDLDSQINSFLDQRQSQAPAQQPEQPDVESETKYPDDGGFLRTALVDVPVTLATSALRSMAGDGLRWAGEAINLSAVRSSQLRGANQEYIDELVMEGTPAGNLIRGAGDSSYDAINRFRDWSVSETNKMKLEGAMPSGDLHDPSSWKMGEDPTFAGYVMMAADLAGSYAPEIAASFLTRGLGSTARIAAPALASAGSGGGAQSRMEQERIEKMGHGELSERSALYNELLERDWSEEDAKTYVTRMAEAGGAEAGGALSALGGAWTGFFLGPAKRFVKGMPSKLKRTAALGGASGAVEGGHEYAIGRGTKLESALNIGEHDRNLTEDSFRDTVLGVAGGLGTGGVSGFRSEGPDASKPPAPEVLGLPPPPKPADPEQLLLTDDNTIYAESSPESKARRENARKKTGKAFYEQQGEAKIAPLEGELVAPESMPKTVKKQKPKKEQLGLTDQRELKDFNPDAEQVGYDPVIYGRDENPPAAPKRIGRVAPERQDGMEKPYTGPTKSRRAISEEEQAAADAKALKNKKPTIAKGGKSKAWTPENDEVAVTYGVVDLSELQISHDEAGRANKNYPQELQQRERENAASREWIAATAARLNPARLADSPNVSDGAPIIGEDGAVESGNGRAAALRLAYQMGTHKAKEYKAYIEKKARELGIPAEQMMGMKNPVLVRIRDNAKNDRLEFTRKANKSQTSQENSFERARTDAELITGEMMTLWNVPATGDEISASNKAFTDSFGTKLGANERNALQTNAGAANQQMKGRLRRAIFHKAYKNESMLESLANQDGPFKNIMAALAAAAPDFAIAESLNKDIAKPVIESLVEAFEVTEKAREKELTINELASQVDAFSEPMSQEVKALANYISVNRSKPARLGEMIKQIAAMTREQAEQSMTESLFGGEPVSTKQVINEAEKRAEGTVEADISGSTPESQPAKVKRTGADTASESTKAEQVEQPLLEAYTAAEVQARKDKESEAAKKQAADDKALADKQQAEKEVDSFVLSGSKSKTDVAEANGQTSLLDLPRVSDEQLTVIDPKVETNPSEAQKEAGNYKKAHINFNGLEITIENPAGSSRSGVAENGASWSVEMQNDYGYVKRTEGADGDQVDVFLGKDTDSQTVFVIDQQNTDGTFDEHKVMLGFTSEADAVKAYKSNYEKGWKVGDATEMTMSQFKKWVNSGDTKKPAKEKEFRNGDEATSREITSSTYKRAQANLSKEINTRFSGRPAGGKLNTDRSYAENPSEANAKTQRDIESGTLTKKQAGERLKDLEASKQQVTEYLSNHTKDQLNTNFLKDYSASMKKPDIVESIYNNMVSELKEFISKPDSESLDSPSSTTETKNTDSGTAMYSLKDSSVKDISSKWNKQGVKLSLREGRSGLVTLDKIIVPEDKQGQGIGTKVMTDLINYADSKGLKIALTPSTDFGGESVARIAKLYKSLGFVDNKGRNKDFEVSESMYRDPQAVGRDADNGGSLSTGSPNVSYKQSPDSAKTTVKQKAAELKTEIDDALGEVGKRTTVVQSVSDLPQSAQDQIKADGVSHSDVMGIWVDGKAYIIADNITSTGDAVKAALHEAVGHEGVKAVLGNELDTTMKQIYKSFLGSTEMQKIKKAYPHIDASTEAGRLQLAQELIAHMAENNVKPNLLRKAVSAIKTALRKVFPDIEWKVWDAYALIDQAKKHLERGGESVQIDSAPEILYKKKPADAFTDLSDAQKAMFDKVGRPETIVRAGEWLAKKFDRIGLRLRNGIVDSYSALHELDVKRWGKDVVDQNIQSSSWVLARISAGSAGVVQTMMEMGHVYWDAKNKVIDVKADDFGNGGLTGVLYKLGESAEIQRFMLWIAANRSSKLEGEGRENLFTSDEIKAGMDLNLGNTNGGKDRAKLYDEVFKEFQVYRDDVLAIAESAGIITKENRAMWRDEFYVPFYRVQEESDASTRGSAAKNNLTRQEAYKKLKGGSQNLENLLQNTMMNFNHLIAASLKNVAAQQAIDNAVDLGIATPTTQAKGETGKTTFVLKDGAQQWFEISDPLIYNSLAAMSDPAINFPGMDVMRKFKRWMTTGITATPQFIFSIIMRDSLQAISTSKMPYNPVMNAFSGAKNYGLDSRKSMTKARMMATGGSMNFGHIFGTDPDAAMLSIDTDIKGMSNADKLNPLKWVGKGWDKWMQVNNTAENANRATIFNHNYNTNKLLAAFEARDLIDYSQRGVHPTIRFLVDTVPFFNAGIQGLDKVYRTGVKPNAAIIRSAFGGPSAAASDKAAAKRFNIVTGAVALATVSLFLHNRENEEYNKLEDWDKDTYFHFFVGDAHIRMHKPFELGSIATLAERMTEQLVDDEATGKLFAQRLGHMVANTFRLDPTPQAINPLVEIAFNKSKFTGRDIENLGQKRLSPSLRKNTNTTKLAEWASQGLEGSVGKVLGKDSSLVLSPVQIDHLIGGYLGQLGMSVSATSDVILRTALGETKPEKYWNEYQPIKRFYADTNVPGFEKYGTLFNDRLREVRRIYSDLESFREVGRMEAAKDIALKNKDRLAQRKTLEGAARKLSSLRARAKIVRSSNMDSERMRQELDRIRFIQNRIQEKVVKGLDIKI